MEKILMLKSHVAIPAFYLSKGEQTEVDDRKKIFFKTSAPYMPAHARKYTSHQDFLFYPPGLSVLLRCRRHQSNAVYIKIF